MTPNREKQGHITKYGNYYTSEEWTETQAEFARQAAEEKKITDKIEGMEKYLRRQLKEEGLNQSQVNQVVSLFVNDRFADANIKFTSVSRQTKISDLWSRWNTAMNKLEVY